MNSKMIQDSATLTFRAQIVTILNLFVMTTNNTAKYTVFQFSVC